MIAGMKKAAIGIDIGGTNIKLGLVDEKGRILLRDTFRTKDSSTRDGLIDKLASHIRALSDEARHRGLKLQGVGIGAPGPIDVERGFVYFFPNIPGWKNTPLKALLEKRIRMAVFVENDANAMALGEFRFGAGKGVKDMVALTLGTGLGGGLVVNGRLYHGPHFSAAEVGHMIVDPKGPLCGCGNRGCIETFVGNGYFVAEVRRELKRRPRTALTSLLKGGQELTPKLVQDAAFKGDAFCKAQWARTGDRLGSFLAGLVNLLNPEKIVIGGGLAQSGPLLFGPVRAAIKKKAFPIASRFVKVVPAQLGPEAGLVGAAALALS